MKRYRKALIAALGALVTIGHAFGLPITEELSVKVVALFDAVAALLVYFIPNIED